MIKRLMCAAALTVLGPASWQAAVFAHEAGEHSEQTVIKSRTFTVPAGQCPQLPANVSVQGLGLERTTTTIDGGGDKGEDRGSVGLRGNLLTRISGTATDSLGGTYTFSYQLSFKRPISIPGTATVIDTFKLTGNGVANGMSTFFRATVNLDSGFNPIFATLRILEQSGDPFVCDPL
jgi:hypothetical protein